MVNYENMYNTNARFRIPFKGYNSDRTLLHFAVFLNGGMLICYISNYTVAYQGVEIFKIGSVNYTYDIVDGYFYMRIINCSGTFIPFAAFAGTRAEEMYNMDFVDA